MANSTNAYVSAEQSIRDLAKIYKPTPAEVPAFVRKFANKYRIIGYDRQLRNIVRDAMGYKVSD